MTRRIIALAVSAVMASAVVLAQQPAAPPDVSGAWSGTIDIPEKGKRERNVLHASFKQSGDGLTGTVGPEPDAQLAITKGRVEGTKYGTLITFDLPTAGYVMHFELQPHGGGILRGVARLDGERVKASVELRQAK